MAFGLRRAKELGRAIIVRAISFRDFQPTPFCWTLQQDGALSHTARKNTLCCVCYLQRENVQFVEPDMWPRNSPALNPVDYAVWGEH